MRLLLVSITLMAMGLFFVSCDSGSDSGGVSGGSGETSSVTETASDKEPAATTETSTSEKSTSSEESASSKSPSTSSTIYLSASSDFICSGNWSKRDGAMALDAYSGNGTCSAKFPGADGTYKIVLNAQLERDGQPSYIISVDGADVNGGRYPLSDPRGCSCSYEDCPDKNYNISAGTYNIKYGSTIGFYGTDDYPCGSDHGAYAKWHGMTFTRVN